jgi:hypothetical protein
MYDEIGHLYSGIASKQNKKLRADRVAQVVERLSSKHETLCSNPSAAK